MTEARGGRRRHDRPPPLLFFFFLSTAVCHRILTCFLLFVATLIHCVEARIQSAEASSSRRRHASVAPGRRAGGRDWSGRRGGAGTDEMELSVDGGVRKPMKEARVIRAMALPFCSSNQQPANQSLETNGGARGNRQRLNGSTSSRDADAADRVMRLGKEEDLLARIPFLGGGGEEDAEGQQGQWEGEEEDINTMSMCFLPFTQPSPLSPSPSLTSLEDKEDDRWSSFIVSVWERPSPSPDNRSTSTSDPLYRAVLRIPTTPAPPTAAEDLLALARNHGIF
ncbi:hypothetical protein HU200_010649 [Digitaria exilis]|uniref:Uncharacterized protein n=1 Tax=Digitaria exilis TaxID=1010633 RepID=A0A835FII3_9POAL|nr:hypothetical protein HU200_010649 [Digitaria exilis]